MQPDLFAPHMAEWEQGPRWEGSGMMCTYQIGDSVEGVVLYVTPKAVPGAGGAAARRAIVRFQQGRAPPDRRGVQIGLVRPGCRGV